MDDLSFLDKYAQPKPVTTDYDGFIEESASKYGVDPDLIRLQMGTESAFKPKARSPKGASGLMQLMPGTARNLGVKDIYDPKQNIEGGVKYMRQLLDMFDGDVNLALAGYNAGEGAVQKYGNKIPPYKETRNYVKKIAGNYKGTGYHPTSLNFLDKYVDAPSDDAVVDVPDVDNGLSFLDKYVGEPQDPGTIYGMTDADIGATPPSTDPVPETPDALQKQILSTFEANSPKSMTLLTNGNPANNFILSMSEAKRLTRVNTPNGIVLVNTKKLGIKPSEATEYVKKNGFAQDSGFVIDMGNNTGDGQPAVAAIDPNTGKEVFAAVTPDPVSAQVQAQKNAAMFPGTVQVPTNTDEVVANRMAETPLDPNVIATAEPNQGGAYQGQPLNDMSQVGMNPTVRQPIGKRPKVAQPQRPSQQSGTVNFDVDPNDPGVQAALAAQAADPNAALINAPQTVGGVQYQEIDSRDGKAVGGAYADIIDIPTNVKDQKSASDYALKYLQAKYPNGKFSGAFFPKDWNAGDPIGITYDTLQGAGVDIAPDIAQKVAENNVTGDARVSKRDFGYTTETEAEKNLDKRIKETDYAAQEIASEGLGDLLKSPQTAARKLGWAIGNYWRSDDVPAPSETWVKSEKDRLLKQYGNLSKAWTAEQTYQNADGLEKAIRFANQTSRSFVKNLVGGTVKSVLFMDNLLEPLGVNHFLPEKAKISIRNAANVADFFVRAMQGDTSGKNWQDSNTDLDKTTLFKSIQEFDKAIGDDPVLKGRLLGAGGDAFGSAMSFVAMAALMPSLKTTNFWGNVRNWDTAIAGALQSAGSGYEEGKNSKLTETQAKIYGGIQGLLGTTEALGAGAELAHLLKNDGMKTIRAKLAEGILDVARHGYKEGKQEFAQEVFQTTSGKVALEYLKDNDPSLIQKITNVLDRLPKQFRDTVTNEGLIALVTGGTMGAGTKAASTTITKDLDSDGQGDTKNKGTANIPIAASEAGEPVKETVKTPATEKPKAEKPKVTLEPVEDIAKSDKTETVVKPTETPVKVEASQPEVTETAKPDTSPIRERAKREAAGLVGDDVVEANDLLSNKESEQTSAVEPKSAPEKGLQSNEKPLESSVRIGGLTNVLIEPDVFNSLPTEKQAKVRELIEESRKLNVQVPGIDIGPDQVARMSDRQKSKNSDGILRRSEIVREIRQLLKPDEQITAEAVETRVKEINSRIGQIDSQVKRLEGLGTMSHLPNGKLKKGYQRAVDLVTDEKAKLEKELASLAQSPAPAKVGEQGAKEPAVVEGEAAKSDATRDFVLPKAEVTRPLADKGLTSYRYRTDSGGHVAIGAKDNTDALNEAGRSITGKPDVAKLDVWNGTEYVPVTPTTPDTATLKALRKLGYTPAFAKTLSADERARILDEGIVKGEYKVEAKPKRLTRAQKYDADRQEVIEKLRNTDFDGKDEVYISAQMRGSNGSLINTSTVIKEAGLEDGSSLNKYRKAKSEPLRSVPDIIDSKGINYERAKDVAGRIERGEAEIRRLNPAGERGRVAGGKRAIESSLILSSSERASEESGSRTRPVERQERVLEEYAKREGIWIDPDKFSPQDLVGKGMEARVYNADAGKSVVKVVDYKQIDKNATPLDFIDNRIAAFNQLFPETAYELVGFTRTKDGFRFVIKQPLIRDAVYTTAAERQAFMKSKGFEMVDRYGEEFANKFYHVRDLHEKNALIKSDGTILVIDAVTTAKPIGNYEVVEKGEALRSTPEIDAVELVKDKDGNLLAPNGKKSNLNERNWREVRTPSFIKYFGDWINDPENASKVVDENGEPLVVYHGTNADVETFSKTKLGANTKARSAKTGFFFTNSSDIAHFFADDRMNPFGSRSFNDEPNGQPNIIPAYLRIERPLRTDIKGLHDLAASGNIDTAKYDGIIATDEKTGQQEILVFEPNQIKSAIGNNGNFDPSDPSILRSVADTPFYSRVESVIRDKMPNKATSAQVTALLAKNSVKELDPEFQALKVWLEGQDGTIGKGDVLEFAAANKVVVSEVVKGDNLDRVEAWWNDEGGANEETPWAELSEAEQKDAARQYREDVEQWDGDPDAVSFAQFQLPGESENYREEFLTAPEKNAISDKELDEFETLSRRMNGDPNWSDKDTARYQELREKKVERFDNNWKDGHQDYNDVVNPIARIRYNDRTTTDGDKMLFAEEFQQPSKENLAKMPKVYQKFGEQMAIRKMLYRAVEGGYDYFGFTTGQQQADRYDLSKQISNVNAGKGNDGKYHLQVRDKNGNMVDDKTLTAEQLPEYIGKDLAQKIIDNPDVQAGFSKDFSGLDLKVGGEGLINRYDRKHVDYINKLMKPYGVSVEAKDISTLDPEAGFDDGSEKETIHAVRISPEFRKAVEASMRDNGGAFPLFKVRTTEDSAELKQLAKSKNFSTDIVPHLKTTIKTGQFGKSILSLDNNQTVEFARTLLAITSDVSRDKMTAIDGLFLDPQQVANIRDAALGVQDAFADKGKDTKPIEAFVKALDKAASVNGTVQLEAFENARGHETGHAASYLGAGEKALVKRRSGLKELADTDPKFAGAFNKWAKIEGRNWTAENATPSQLAHGAEEVATYIADGQHSRLGLTYAQGIKLGVELQLRYAQARIDEGAANVAEALAIFDGTIFEQYKEAINEREQSNKSDKGNVESKGAGQDNEYQGRDPGTEESDGDGVSSVSASEQKAKGLDDRRPGKSGLPFDEKEAREADAKGRKVAAISRIIGVEIYYDPQTNEETAVKAEQLTGRVGVQKAISDALTGKPSAEGMKVVYNEFSRLNALYDHFNEQGNEAEAIAIATELADLANAIQERQLATGQEAQIARTFDILSPDIALLMAQRRIINKRGEGAKLTPEETAATIDAAKQLSKIEAQLDETRRKLRNSEAARRRLESDKEPRKRAATSQEKLLKEYQEQKTDLFAQLEKLFPDSPLFNGKEAALRMVAASEAEDFAHSLQHLLGKPNKGLTGMIFGDEQVAKTVPNAFTYTTRGTNKNTYQVDVEVLKGEGGTTRYIARDGDLIVAAAHVDSDHQLTGIITEPGMQKVGIGTNLLKEIQRLDPQLTTVGIASKQGQRVLERAGMGDEVLRSTPTEPLDPLKQEVLTKWTTGQILEGLPYEALIKTLEQFGISTEQAQQIHSDAVAIIKPAREPRTAEAKEKVKIRNEHYREAKKFGNDGKPALSGIAQDAQEDAKYKDDPKLIEVIDYLTNVNTAKAGRSLNQLINGIREANPEMSISQAEALAGRAQQAVNDLRAKRKRAADKAKNISEEARAEINRLTVQKRNASRRMSDHLKQLGRGTEWAMHRFNNLMRAAFVNNWVTQLFNGVQSTVVATPTQMALDGITQLMLRGGLNIGENTEINFADLRLPETYILAGAWEHATTKQLAEQALAQFPEEYFRIHAGILGDIEIDKVAQADTAPKATKWLHTLLDSADKGTDFLSKVSLSKVQEMYFRNAIIGARFDQLIRAKSNGTETLESALKNGEFAKLVTEKDATGIADDALEVTFASEINDPIGKKLKKAYDTLDNFVPIFLNPVTFARFTYTTTKVMVANPLLFGAMDAKAAGGRGYNTKSVAKGVLAWSGVAAAYALTSALGGDDDRWDTLYVNGKDNPPLSIKRFFPLSAYFYVAHLIRQYKEGGTPPTMNDLLEGFASLETEYYNYGPGLGLADAVKRAAYDGTGSKEEVGRASARMMGNFLGGLLNVLKPAKLALSAIDDEEAVLRDDSDTAKEKFLSELSRSIPGVIRWSDAPKKIDPVTDKPILQPWILGRAVGLNFVHPSFLANKDSAATQWANRLFAYNGGGSEMSAEDRNAYFIKKRLKEAMRKGEIDLTTANEKAQKYLAKFLTPESMGRLKKELEMSELQSKVKAGFSIPDDPKKAEKELRDLRTVWNKATDQEKDDLRRVLITKRNRNAEFNAEFGLKDIAPKTPKARKLADLSYAKDGGRDFEPEYRDNRDKWKGMRQSENVIDRREDAPLTQFMRDLNGGLDSIQKASFTGGTLAEKREAKKMLAEQIAESRYVLKNKKADPQQARAVLKALLSVQVR